MKKLVRLMLPSSLKSLPIMFLMLLFFVPAVSLAGGLFYIDSVTGFAGFGNTDPQSQVDVSGAMYSRLVTATTSVINWNQGNVQKETLSSSPTFTFSNGQAGGQYTFILEQDGTGGRTVTWPVSVEWPGAIAPTLSSSGGATDLINFTYDGSNYFGSFNLGYAPSPSPLLNDIVSYFKFTGNSNDSTPSSYNGSDTNISYNSSYGKIGEGASFNGSSSKITIPSGIYSLFDGTSSWTINEWVQLPNLSNQYAIFSVDDGTDSTSHRSVNFYVDPSTGTLDAYRAGGGSLDEITGGTSVGTNTWTMATLTYDGSNLHLYINGTSDATPVASTRTAVTGTRGFFGTEAVTRNWWPGYMDEAGFWSRALSPSEITEIYGSGSGNQYPF